jgi:ribose-phosphate pyrophosphokinase
MAPTAIADKRRIDHTEPADIMELIGSVAGKTALLVDDFTISAGTLVCAAEVLVDRGATAAVSHCLLTESAVARLNNSPIEQLLVTDSVELQASVSPPKVEVVPVAPLFGEAIRRIAQRESISVLFT